MTVLLKTWKLKKGTQVSIKFLMKGIVRQAFQQNYKITLFYRKNQNNLILLYFRKIWKIKNRIVAITRNVLYNQCKIFLNGDDSIFMVYCFAYSSLQQWQEFCVNRIYEQYFASVLELSIWYCRKRLFFILFIQDILLHLFESYLQHSYYKQRNNLELSYYLLYKRIFAKWSYIQEELQ